MSSCNHGVLFLVAGCTCRESDVYHRQQVSPSQQFSEMEKHCFKEARELRRRYKQEEEEEKKKRYAATANWLELSAIT